jgi:membrane protein DedA with SNARE-associated domain
MGSLSQLSNYLHEYGYYAIFLLVFLQQIGVPNPLTNELVLIFCGYLSYTGSLNFYKAILAAVTADFIGSILLFFVFYSFSKWLIDNSPKWMPLTGDKIERLKSKVLKHGQRGIFFARLTPIIRGYVSLAAGMLNISRKAFMGTVIITAIIWNGGLVLIGRLIGPYWSEMSGKLGLMQNIILIIVVIIVIMFVGRYFLRRQTEAEEKK